MGLLGLSMIAFPIGGKRTRFNLIPISLEGLQGFGLQLRIWPDIFGNGDNKLSKWRACTGKGELLDPAKIYSG